MIEQPRHRDPLFLTAAKHVQPVGDSIQSPLSLEQIVELGTSEVVLEDLIGGAATFRLGPRVGIGELVTERTEGHVRFLRDVEQLATRGFDEFSAKQRPQFAEDSEKRGFASTIWTTYLRTKNQTINIILSTILDFML